MLVLNFKKDWKMHKPLLVSFILIALSLFIVITGFYAVIKFTDLSVKTETILTNIWLVVASLVTTLSGILPIVLMYKVLKNDLGKHNVHYTLFTPQNVLSWYLPKIIYVFIVQGLFALINLGYAYYIFDVMNYDKFNVSENIITFLTATLSLGIFGLITLCMAVYYSFRKKGLSWTLIVITIITYFAGLMTYAIVNSIQTVNDGAAVSDTEMLLVQYGIDSGIGLIFILLGLILFSSRIEY